jgi:hypothetical protein
LEVIAVRIIYEHAETWPEDGPLRVEATISAEIPISPDVARRRANGYLAREAALFLVVGEPMLILNDQSFWQFPVVLQLRGYDNVAEVGTITVDAQSGQVRQLSAEDVQLMRERAYDIATRPILQVPVYPSHIFDHG